MSNESTWTQSDLERVEELLGESTLFSKMGRDGIDSAMRDIKKMAGTETYCGNIFTAAVDYISSCEQAHDNALDRRVQEDKDRAIRALRDSELFHGEELQDAMRNVEIIAAAGKISLTQAAHDYIKVSMFCDRLGEDEENHPEQIPLAGGAALSSKIPRLELIPTIALEECAERFELGIKRKKEKSWNALSDNQQVLRDKEFILNRIGHVIYHAMKLRDVIANGDMDELAEGDNHASAIMWGGCFLISAKNALISWQDEPTLAERIRDLPDDIPGRLDKGYDISDEDYSKAINELFPGPVDFNKMPAETQMHSFNYRPLDRPGEDEEPEPLSVNINPFAHMEGMIESRQSADDQMKEMHQQCYQRHNPTNQEQWAACIVYETKHSDHKGPCLPWEYKVRYNHTAPDGSWLFVREYKADPKGGEPAIHWCRYAAERDAAEFNAKKLPPEYFTAPYQQWMDAALKKTFGIEKPENKNEVLKDLIIHKHNQWWFYDETWSHSYGPYNTEQDAREACARYAESLETGR